MGAVSACRAQDVQRPHGEVAVLCVCVLDVSAESTTS